MIVLVAVVATARVDTVNVAVALPAGTVTDAGTATAEVLLLVKLTSAPPAGATLLRVTVPVDDVPPATVAGFTPTPVSVGGGTVTVSVAVLAVPL